MTEKSLGTLQGFGVTQVSLLHATRRTIVLITERAAVNSTKNREIAQGAQHWYEKGTDAMQRRNWAYGLECLERAVRIDPNELVFRKNKHRCCRRRMGNQKQIPRVGKVKLAALRSRLLTAQVKKDWAAIDKLAEDALTIDPWNAEFFALIARAAAKTGNKSISKYAWTCAVKLDGTNIAYYREFGRLLHEVGEYDLARKCYEQIKTLDPTGHLAQELIASVDIASVIDTGGYMEATSTQHVRVGAGSSDDKMASENSAVDEEEVDLCRDHLIASVTLAEEHVKSGRLCSAVEAYRTAQSLEPHNVSIQRRMEDVELAWLRHEAITAQQLAQCDKKPESIRLAKQKAESLNSRELEIRKSRAESEPDHPIFAFQLADSYRRLGQFQRAIPLFETVVKDEELKDEALVGLGECLIHAERASVGHRYLMTALQSVDPEKKPNAFKLAHYWLARLYQAQNYLQQARQHYSIILSCDPGFRDASQRIAKIPA